MAGRLSSLVRGSTASPDVRVFALLLYREPASTPQPGRSQHAMNPYGMSVARCDHIHAYSVRQADAFLRRDGFVAGAIHPFNRRGEQALTVLVGPEDSSVESRPDEGLLIVPAPFQSHKDLLTDVFRQVDVVAATWMGEAWMFPPEDGQEAMQAYLAGTGGPLSKHPDRREVVMVSTLWPLGGYVNVTVNRLVRAGGSAYLRPWQAGEQGVSFRQVAGEQERDAPGLPSFMISWLEECLPSRGQ